MKKKICFQVGHTYFVFSGDTTTPTNQVVKKVKVSEDVFFTSRVYVSSRSFIHQEECEGKMFFK